MKIVDLDKIPKPEKILKISKSDLPIVRKVAKEMLSICCENDGIGLAAAQVGVPWNLFVTRVNGFPEYYVDCEYVAASDEIVRSEEGCLSIRNEDGTFKKYVVDRYWQIKVTGKRLTLSDDSDLIKINTNLHGYSGIVFQHEIDHAKGILISDIGTELKNGIISKTHE